MKQQFIDAIKDRSYLGAVIATALGVLAIFILSIVFIRPNDLQVPLRYSSFGISHIMREKWFNEFLFPLYGVLVAGLNTLIATKLYRTKGRTFGIAWQWLAFAVIAISFMIFLATFKLVSVLQ